MSGRGKRAKAWALAASALLLSLGAAPIAAEEAAPAAISDPITDFGSDPDSDGLFEYLVLTVPLSVERADVYSVSSQVSVEGQGAALSRAGQRFFLDSGEQSVKLTFPGADLARLGAGQTLSFAIIVSDSSGKAVDGRTHVGPLPYSGAMFEGGTAAVQPEFTGVVREVPERADPARPYGYLNITFEVRNITAPSTEVGGTLNGIVKGAGMVRAWFESNRTGFAELRFDGGSIRRLGAPGPYLVLVRLALPYGGEASYEHRTAAYNATDFEAPRPPVAFTGKGSDRGSDADGDGLFDVLEVNIGVSVALEGAYSFKAMPALPERLKPLQDALPRPAAFLDAPAPGNYSVVFNISGQALAVLQLEGPYTLALDAFSERVLYVANGTYTTGAYLPSQFEKPRLPARFAGTGADEAVDRDGNGLFDMLKITVPLEADASGRYQLAGALHAGDRFITWAAGAVDIPAGAGKLSLKFDGRAIRQAGFDGPYTAVLHLGTQAPVRPGLGAYLPPDRLELQTKAYKAAAFEKRPLAQKPLPPPPEPEAGIGEGTNKVRAGTITVEVNRSAPDISFYYTLDDGRSARFRLVFTQLVAFSDRNGNGACDPGEEGYVGALPPAGWQASQLEYSDEQGGRALRYNLTAVLDMWAGGGQAGRPLSRIPQWGRLTFSFTIASRDISFSGPAAFTLRGGAEMKIDILIEPQRELPQGISGLSLQHYLSDESGRNVFRTFEADQTRVFRPGSAGANGTIFKPVLSALQKIGLGGIGGREHGHYSWAPRALVSGNDGTSVHMPVNLSYSTDGRQMALALNYPLPAGAVSILHDPTVGVNATNAPREVPLLRKILFNPWLYIIAALIAVAVVAYMRRSQRNGE